MDKIGTIVTFLMHPFSSDFVLPSTVVPTVTCGISSVTGSGPRVPGDRSFSLLVLGLLLWCSLDSGDLISHPYGKVPTVPPVKPKKLI